MGAAGSWRPRAPGGHVAGGDPRLRGTKASKTGPEESGPAPGGGWGVRVAFFEVHTSHVEPRELGIISKKTFWNSCPWAGRGDRAVSGV